MIFHENCLLADDSHEISYLIFFKNLERCRKILSSAAVVIGALRVNMKKMTISGKSNYRCAEIPTVLPAKSDSDFMFCLQSYQGLIIDRSLV